MGAEMLERGIIIARGEEEGTLPSPEPELEELAVKEDSVTGNGVRPARDVDGSHISLLQHACGRVRT